MFGTGTEYFTIRVDSIVAPASIGPGESLTARFLGRIGPHGCYGLDEVRSARSPGLLLIEFRGKAVDGLCTQEPVNLDHRVDLPPPFDDPFVIRVVQPAGPPLERSVGVGP